MNVKSIAVVDFLVETSGKGICKVGAVILLKPLFPTHHGATIQDLAGSEPATPSEATMPSPCCKLP